MMGQVDEDMYDDPVFWKRVSDDYTCLTTRMRHILFAAYARHGQHTTFTRRMRALHDCFVYTMANDLERSAFACEHVRPATLFRRRVAQRNPMRTRDRDYVVITLLAMCHFVKTHQALLRWDTMERFWSAFVALKTFPV